MWHILVSYSTYWTWWWPLSRPKHVVLLTTDNKLVVFLTTLHSTLHTQRGCLNSRFYAYAILHSVVSMYVYITYICVYLVIYEHMYVFPVVLTIIIYYLLFPHTTFNDFLRNVQGLCSLCSRNWSLQNVRSCRDTKSYQNKYFKIFFPSLMNLFVNKIFLNVGKA